ncbi:MAG: hypothetical protein KBB11_00135 [Bacteroidales bacterium]|nr:hypothetical protein [Bacteroidales bacterium]HQP03922.1 hypothetical protein [Bacteroidales bacterium]
MVINNKELSTKIRLGIMMFALLCLALIVFSLIYAWVPNHLIEIISTCVFVLFAVFILIRKYCYILFNSEGSKIILRYSPLQPLSHGNFSIEIPKKDFKNFVITKSLFGLRRNLIMFVETPQGVAKFKPVSVTSLSKKELTDLIESLQSILK